jgi:hypothetical protein
MTDDPTGGLVCQLVMERQDEFFAQIQENATLVPDVVTAWSRKGQSVTICGAGPSLADHYHEIPHTDEVWACNSALPYLMDQGARVTHGFSIHQTRVTLDPTELGRVFPVSYYLASSVHPDLIRHIQKAGRPISLFHSFLGIDNPEDWDGAPGSYEEWLYTGAKIFKTSVRVSYGLNSAARAICLALVMGFKQIEVYGADCAARPDSPPGCYTDEEGYPEWVNKLVFYADGRTGKVFGERPPMAETVIDGTRWTTRPDMVMSASHLVELAHTYPGIHYVGNTLVNAIIDKDKSFRELLPQMVGGGCIGNFRSLGVEA